MVICLFVDCHKRTDRDLDCTFYRVPKVITNQGQEEEERSRERRERWIAAINRKGLDEKKIDDGRVCNRHFVYGKKAASWDRFHVDWVPTKNPGYKVISKVNIDAKHARAERAKGRRKRLIEQQQVEAEEKRKRVNEPGMPLNEINFEPNEYENDENIQPDRPELEQMSGNSVGDEGEGDANMAKFVEQSAQTEEFEYMFAQSSGNAQPFDHTEFENDNHKVRFYTGLPSYEILIKAFDHISAHVTRKSLHLSKFQEFVMVLLKLRLNAPLQDLAYRFRTSVSTVSRTFAAWMVVMDARLSPLISWPDREDLWATMPQCFQYSFGKKTTVVIDCFEVFIDRPSSLLARAQTFSSYKHHNTIKVLIGITPQGTIAFTSEAWGGRTSDKFLTENCGLDKLLPGDMVMADRGFTVQESVMFKQAQLVIPAFTRGKDQLCPFDVEKTREIANVRIHVERVIGLLRRKYTILEGILPIDYLVTKADARVPMVDRIIRVCASLVNLCPPIIPFD